MSTADKNHFMLNRSRKNLRRDVGRAIADFDMIQDGDLVMVCLSGGKDSYTLLDILSSLQRHAPINYELHAVNLDQKQPGFPEHVLPEYLENLGVTYKILEQDTYSIVTDKVPVGKTFCGLCSRLRRGILYNYVESIGANKIALGHHRDDIVETLFLNMFYGGKLTAMPPKLLSDDKRNIVIRPLAYCKEAEISRYAELAGFPIIPCDLCGSQDNLKRQAIKGMLRGWQRENPGRVETIFRAICNVSPSQLADSKLFNFSGFESLRRANSENLNLMEVK
ncbi:MAG: tRNA 2-thiocytidine(32) synthetase TtcA [Pseudomonadota bacterium]|nr:tRNA 2-thiocytidine(32) synthetase TtcA [Pseudomonadota bacterium]